MTDLSILIPSRNEMFLLHTIEDILEHIELDTEIIVTLDGAWPIDPIPDHERITLIYHNQSVGQRAATNDAARIARGRYLMKCDAHCSFDQGFDRKMIEDMQPDWTMVPRMYNLHAFDWVCNECGHRRYQGPTRPCEKCNGEMRREMVWQPRKSPCTTAMRFDRNLKFQYWSGYKKRQSGDLVDTMSILGACFLMTADKYWELDICDEGHGGWGQQGTEVACKTWLSGGRLVCTKKTWFAHMFRTQGGDFGFPYPLSGGDVRRAREYSQRLWVENTWPKAKHSLQWLIEKFAPVPEWDDVTSTYDGTPTVGVVYYTDNKLDPAIMEACQTQLNSARGDARLVSVSLEPIDFGENIVLNEKRGYLTMFKQILAGLEAIDTDIVFLAEHDVLYHPSHFEFRPERDDLFYYNQNRWQVCASTGKALFYMASSTSGLCAVRSLLLEHYRKRVKMVEEGGFTRRMGFEPGTHGRPERVDDHKSEVWMSDLPNLDIRHGSNLTKTRWSKDEFRNKRFTAGWTESDSVPGWGKTKGRFMEVLDGLPVVSRTGG